MKSLLRALTIICYFLPVTFFVTTCNGLELKFAYNSEDAKRDEAEGSQVQDSTVNTNSHHIDASAVIDTSSKATPGNEIYTDSLQSERTFNTNDTFGKKVLKFVIAPTSNSLSGIGSIFYFKNLTGKILMAICFLISLIVLVVGKLLKRKNLILHFVLGNILCLVAFIIVSFISNVELHWGIWVLLLLIVVQFIVEKGNKLSNTALSL
jgi:hypothetical protein